VGGFQSLFLVEMVFAAENVQWQQNDSYFNSGLQVPLTSMLMGGVFFVIIMNDGMRIKYKPFIKAFRVSFAAVSLV
jgi:hypothetical protein